MAEIREGRHLAAILFVDMVGYTARMQANEPAAIAAVGRLWDLTRPILAAHGGREVDLAGDGMLMEFPGALAAVNCALKLHRALHEMNAPLPEANRIRVRAGAHLGDVEHRDGKVFGDGVNIAARVLSLAPPGGVAMTPHMRDQLLNVLPRPPESLGVKRLRNVREPMEVWCLRGPDCSASDVAAARQAGRDEAARRRWTFGTAVLDERTFELTVGGVAVEIEKKALDVLMALLQHAGEVATKDELLEAVWPGRVVGENVLTKCIARIREVLGDADQKQLKTVHGFGYRLVAPVSVDTFSEEPAPRLDFKEGDKLAGRPLWTLAQHLGGGGAGEVWRVVHDKTREQRVYKFALEARALDSLRREITLSRVLRDSLGERPDLVRILDWNLQEPPYFIECEYVDGGNLAEWIERRGGFDHVPLAERVALLAQVAETVAAAHDVGVLHKDLKPGNVLVAEGPDGPQTRLCDFGAGGVLDPQRFEELGITRMGFTRTVFDVGEAAGGTLLYVAPEVLAGQPATAKADIYALGVMLYRMIIGDFRKALAPGWEADVPDELLRADIAAAAHGNPALRLADAAELAGRLRTLEGRRASREAERNIREQAERAGRLQQEYSRLRRVAVAMAVLVAIAAAAGFEAWRQRGEAIAARDTAASSAAESLAAMTVRRRAPTVEERVAEFVEVHEKILEHCDQTGCAQQYRAQTKMVLADLYGRQQRHADSARLYDEAAAHFAGSGGAELRSCITGLAQALAETGAFERAEQALQRIPPSAWNTIEPNSGDLGTLRRVQGLIALSRNDYPLARERLRQALAAFGNIHTHSLKAAQVREDIARVPPEVRRD